MPFIEANILTIIIISTIISIIIFLLYFLKTYVSNKHNPRLFSFYGKYASEIIPPPTRVKSRQNAKQREDEITSLMKEYKFGLDVKDGIVKNYLPFVYREIPPGNINNINKIKFYESDINDAIAQAIRLNWQIKSEGLLLCARVSDALTIFDDNRVENVDELENRFMTVGIRYEGTTGDRIPWRIIIKTNEPNTYIEYIKSISDWLGIAVSIVKVPGYNHFGMCEMEGGKEGVIGGIFSRERESNAVTCAHVLSPTCRSKVYVGKPDILGEQPDIGLINSDNPCFEMPSELQYYEYASSDEIINFKIGQSPIVRLENKMSKKKAKIIDIQDSKFVGKYNYRFPHIDLVPIIKNYQKLFPQFILRPFSTVGDSGTWLIERETKKWIGMIDGGYEEHFLTYAIQAEHLMQYINSVMWQRNREHKPYKIQSHWMG